MRARTTGLIVLISCVLGACGGDEPSGDDEQIRAALTEGLTTKDPDVCTRLATPAFLEQSTGKRGKAAIAECRENADEADADSISIQRVDISGARAQADVLPKGGDLPFRSVTIGLRKTGGAWKFDRLEDGTLDRAAFFRVTRKALTSSPDALSADTVDCVLRDFKGVDDDAIERALIKPDPRVFLLPVAICGIRNEFAGSGVPEPIVRCFSRRIRRELTTGPTGRKLAADPAGLEALLDSAPVQRKIGRIALSCVPASQRSGMPADGRVS